MFNAAHRITQWSAFSCTSENMRITDCTRLRCTAQYARGVRNCRLHSVKSFVPVNADSRENASWFEKKWKKKKNKNKKKKKKINKRGTRKKTRTRTSESTRETHTHTHAYIHTHIQIALWKKKKKKKKVRRNRNVG